MSHHWSGNNRARWHDYRARKIYHITLKKHRDAPVFGRLAGDWHLPAGTPGSSYLMASPLGRTIKDCLRELPRIHPALRLYQYALMPDHLHLIISVEEPLDDILGRKLAIFKVIVNTRSRLPCVFEKGFNDQILRHDRKLDTIFNYLRDNPRRLAIRLANPDYFRRINQVRIGTATFMAYGNYNLLTNPFKEQVVVHRADSPEKLAANREHWLHTAANGGVLVSPFISKAEKSVRDEAENLGGRTIFIVHEAFGERYKPAFHDFDLCSEGRLLIITLGLPTGTPLSRAHCLRMNALAEALT